MLESPHDLAVSREKANAQTEDPVAQNEYGLSLFAAKNFREAAQSFRRAISLDPNVAAYHENLGMALMDQGMIVGATESFQTAISLKSDSFLSLLSLARLMQTQEKRAEADFYFRRALDAKPNSYYGRLRWATALMQFQDLAGAEEQARLAIGLKPDDFTAYETLGLILSRQGRFDEAVEQFERAIALEPARSPKSLQGLVTAKKITLNDKLLVDKMIELTEAGGLPPEAEVLVRGSLGKALDDLGDYGGAFMQFNLARECAIRRSKGARPLDRQSVTRFVEAAEHHFSKDAFTRFSHGVASDLPIFIVGMPRSGTTLLEQIISSHPEVGAAGEVKFWRKSPIAKDLTRTFVPAFAREQAVEYRMLLRGLVPGRRRVTDKNPLNYSLLGPLHLLFPNARIVHIRRHPVDTCLSILMNPLLLESLPDFAYDLDDLVFFYRQYQRIMDLWRNVLPANRLLEIHYEELVTDREAKTREIIDFLGLTWDDSCLRYEQNDRGVSTPSQWQARQPIYKTSMERWRKYEPWLGPLRELLE